MQSKLFRVLRAFEIRIKTDMFSSVSNYYAEMTILWLLIQRSTLKKYNPLKRQILITLNLDKMT